MGKLTISMAIFHSYIKLPEGTYLGGGWALPLWKMMEFVSWGYYSQYVEKQKMFQTTNQPFIDGFPSKPLLIIIAVY